MSCSSTRMIRRSARLARHRIERRERVVEAVAGHPERHRHRRRGRIERLLEVGGVLLGDLPQLASCPPSASGSSSESKSPMIASGMKPGRGDRHRRRHRRRPDARPRAARSRSTSRSTAPPPTITSRPSKRSEVGLLHGGKSLALDVRRLAGVVRTIGPEKNPLNLNQVMLAEEVRDGKGASRPHHLTLSSTTWPQSEGNEPCSSSSHCGTCGPRLSRAPAAAEEVPILRIYTYDSFAAEWGPGPQLKAGFEKTCGCIVEFVATDCSIGALRRVQLEGDTTEADIVLGLDTAVAGEARATGLFAPHGLDLSGLLPPSPQDRRLRALRLRLLRLRLRQGPRAQSAGLVRGADRDARRLQDRHRGPALRYARPRPRALDQGALRRPRARDLGRPQAARPHRRARLVRGLLRCSSRARPTWCCPTRPRPPTTRSPRTTRATPPPTSAAFYAQVEVAGILKSSEKQDWRSSSSSTSISPEAQAVIPTTNWMYSGGRYRRGLPAGVQRPRAARRDADARRGDGHRQQGRVDRGSPCRAPVT